MQDQIWDPAAEQADKDYFYNTCCQFDFIVFLKNLPKYFLQKCDQISDQADRMIEPPGISYDEIKDKACPKGSHTVINHT